MKKKRIKLIEQIKRILPKEKTWGGYDGEEIIDDKENYGYNQALSEIHAKIPAIINYIYDNMKKKKCPKCGETLKEKYISGEHDGIDISCYEMVCPKCDKRL